MGIRQTLLIATTVLLWPSLGSGQNPAGKLLVAYNRGLLTLSVENGDLKQVLTAVAEETGISVKYPPGVEKRITTEFRALPFQRGLHRILRGMNYALIYSRSARKREGDIVSGVYVVSKQSSTSSYTSRASVRTEPPEDPRAAAIERYRRRLDLLERQLGQAGVGTPRGKAIDKQIRSLEQRIERLIQQ
jgi:hypothetical protein